MIRWTAAFCAVAAIGAPAAAQTRLDHLSATDLFALADQARASGRLEDAAAMYDALSKDPDLQVRSEARFRKGMMLVDAKRWRDAAIAFRAVLDEQPGAARVRLELARALVALGDESAARREIRQAQAAGLPPEVAQSVGRFDRALRSRKRFGGTFEFALAPDSNINRSTDARTLDTIIAPLTLSDDARAQSGLGVHLAGQAYARIALGGGFSFLPKVAGLATLYGEGKFNDVSGSALAGLEWVRRRDKISLAAGPTRRWYGGRPYADTRAISVDWLHGVDPTTQVIANASVSRAKYALNDLQNGTIYDIGLSAEKAVSARVGVSVALSGTRQTARDPGYATKAGGLTLTGWYEAGRTTWYVSASARRTEADAALFLFGARRLEWLFSARAGATFRQLSWHGFAPYARIAAERNASTVTIYDYRRLSTEIGLTRAF